MKAERLKKRLNPDRPMSHVTIRMPDDVIQDLKQLAPELGFSGYQPLIRAFIGQGMRKDLKKLEADKVAALINGLKKRGVSDKVIKEAISEADTSS